MRFHFYINNTSFWLQSDKDKAELSTLSPAESVAGFNALLCQSMLKFLLDKAPLPISITIPNIQFPSHFSESRAHTPEKYSPEKPLLVLLDTREFQKIQSPERYIEFGVIKETEETSILQPYSREWLINLLLPNEYAVATQIISSPDSKDFQLLVRNRIRSIKEFEPVQELLAAVLEDIQTSKLFETKKQAFIQLKLTSACNFSCDFCYYPTRAIYLQKEKIDQLLKLFQTAIPAESTVLLLHGGEPLLYPQFDFLVNQLYDKYTLIMTTNGVLIPKHIDALKKIPIPQVAVSTDPVGRYHSPLEFESALIGMKAISFQNSDYISLTTVLNNNAQEIKSWLRYISACLDGAPIRASSERIVPSRTYTHLQYFKDMQHLYSVFSREHNIYYQPKLGGFKSAPGCGSCASFDDDFISFIIDADESIRFCSKNYRIPSSLTVDQLLTVNSKNLLKTLRKHSHIDEYRRRRKMCILVGCPYTTVCHTGCANYPIFDESGLCAQLIMKSLL